MYKPGRPFKYDPNTGAGVKPQPKPGEYRIRDSGGSIIYIGETVSLPRRMDEHRRSGRFDGGGTFEYKTADGRSSSRTRREHERVKIQKHKPILNKSGGGEGRIAK